MRRRAAVLGRPIAHSLSPALHRAAYEEMGIAGQWGYESFEVDEEGLEPFLVEVGALGEDAPGPWAGFSLTMPLKRRALALADRATTLAKATGVANTWTREEDGWLASNTDVHGMMAALMAAPASHDDGSSLGMILGAGATAASALAVLDEIGATEIVVWARDAGRAEAVLTTSIRLGIAVTILPWSAPADPLAMMSEARHVIVTLPTRVADPLAEALHEAGPRLEGRTLLDVAYDPWPSALTRAWLERGGVAASGREMLLHQAAQQVEAMTGRAAPIEAMRGALMEE